ncbi:hypothetical protein Sste5346_002335 [Sporothrix stenoceras]|uniref:Ankyrin repeat protein n=1 Tax=Sporothrix stenoceras TaxID=5173 RepID=A0ABR3ZK66_9PEZI
MSCHPPFATAGLRRSGPRPAQPRSFKDYKNEEMISLSKALAANDLSVVDALISRYDALSRMKPRIIPDNPLAARTLAKMEALTAQYKTSGPWTGNIYHIAPWVAPIMHDAIEIDNAEFTKGLLERGMLLHGSYVKNAIEVHAMRCLTLFLQRGHDLNKPQGKTRPPVWAYCVTDWFMLQWLLDHGADLNTCAPCDGTTPMSYVVQFCPPEIIHTLLEDPRGLVDVNKSEVLHYALARTTDVLPVLVMLLDHGAPINAGLYANNLGAQNMFFFMARGPPLHKAADEGNLDAVRFLLSRHADVMICDTQGHTALYYAQKNGHTAIIELLKSAMADFKVQHL